MTHCTSDVVKIGESGKLLSFHKRIVVDFQPRD